MSLINSTAIPSGATGYEIDQSLRFEDGSGAYLSRTPSASNRKTWTWSGWVKRGNLGTYQTIFAVDNSSTEMAECYWDGSDNSIFWHLGGGSNYRFYTNAIYRDSSAWYHIVCSLDTTISSPSGNNTRMKLYVNGEQVTSFRANATPSLNYEGLVNLNTQHEIGERNGTHNPLDGYLAEVNFIDGTALTSSSFGETGDYGEWKPIEYSGSYGTNGFYLNFATASDMGDDKSGNTNDWTENNIAATDQMVDSPTNNFATFNPLARHVGLTISEGNLRGVRGSGAWAPYFCTMGMTSGKWYWEVYVKASNDIYLGMTTDDWVGTGAINTAGAYSIYSTAGGTAYRYDDGTQTNVYTFQGNYEWHWGADIIIQFAYDSDTGKFWMGKANTWFSSGNPSTGATPLLTVAAANRDRILPAGSPNSSNTNIFLNFGQDSSFAGEKTAQGNTDGNDIGDFYYTPPTGYLALCTKNLPDVAVVPSEHFNTVLYTGNGGTQAITGVGFQSDLVWTKGRSSAWQNRLTDVIRGTSKQLESDSTGAENTSNDLTSFDSDGFTLGSSNNGNANAVTFVAWNWKANGSGSSNTNGSITSTVSANVDAGFSIVGYTGNNVAGATIGHGLSAKPDLIIVKIRADNYTGRVYNSISGATKYLDWASTAALGTYQHMWNNTEPTSSVFSVGHDVTVGGYPIRDFIAYCFHSVDGYSKVGSYTGNTNADGTFVYTGFKPAYVMVKNTSGWGWYIHDSVRHPDNENDLHLLANSSAADSATDNTHMDFLSNGFKLRTASIIGNGSAYTLIYIAFAETPFKYSNAN